MKCVFLSLNLVAVTIGTLALICIICPTQPQTGNHAVLNAVLTVHRYVPSQADVVVFDAISSPPLAELCHALRWYNHIKSYQSQKNRWRVCEEFHRESILILNETPVDNTEDEDRIWHTDVYDLHTICDSLPGVKKPLGEYGPAGVADTTAGSTPAKEEEEGDDDIDLFGSDDEASDVLEMSL